MAVGSAVATGLVAWLFVAAAEDSWTAIGAPGPAGPADGILLAGALLGAALVAWLGLGLVLTALSALPGAVGDGAALLAARLAPLAVRKTVAFLLGTTLTAALVPGSAVADSGDVTARATSSTSQSQDAPRRPAVDGGPAPADAGVLSTLPDPSFQALAVPAQPDPLDPAWTPERPHVPRVAPDAPIDLLSRSAGAGRVVDDHVVVRRGDTLWDIAARHLGPGATSAEIASEWPRWFETNRAKIGDDPDLIRPGQLLAQPQSPRGS